MDPAISIHLHAFYDFLDSHINSFYEMRFAIAVKQKRKCEGRKTK